MSYFPELSPYTYYRFREDEGKVIKNVGWLESGKPVPTVDEYRPLREPLVRKLARIPIINHMRGFHNCDLCAGGRGVSGNGEIRVEHKGVIYAAPALIHHYITEHGYYPPEEFIIAVMEMNMGDYLGDYPREELEKYCHALVTALGYFLPENQGIMIEYAGEKLVVYSTSGQIRICDGSSVEGFTPGAAIQMLEDHEEPPKAG